MKHALLMGIALLFLVAGCTFAQETAGGYWPFDGNLNDATGAFNATGAANYAPGHNGQALDPNWHAVTIADNENLRLNVGLTIDCWVYWAAKPVGYQTIVAKQNEYQLRVDSDSEGGRFSFFVFLNGWEPRVSGSVPKAHHWYHLIAKWTGSQTVLHVDDATQGTSDTYTSARQGVPLPTHNPVSVGNCSCLIDDLHIDNPVLARNRKLRMLLEAVPAIGRSTSGVFGGAKGWSNWQAAGSAKMKVAKDAIAATMPDSKAMIVDPALNVPLGPNKWVSLQLDAPGAQMAQLTFITDHGLGIAPLMVWGDNRPSVVDLSSLPQWTGTLKLLALSFNDDKPHQAKLSGLWIGPEPRGNPWVYVRGFAPYRAIMRAGRQESMVAAVRNLGARTHGVRVELDAPPGVTLLGDKTKTIADLDYNTVALLTWKMRADKPIASCKFTARVVGASAEQSKSFTATFTPPLHLPKASYVPVPKPVKSKYLILMHYCPLWKEGTHYGWEKIEPWPGRRPDIGWFDGGTPEVADWQIKDCVEHGINGFIYCWYRDGFSPKIKQSLGYALQDGLFHARYRNMFKFAIMWENGCGTGAKSRADIVDNLMPFWIKNYFKKPYYVKIDNKPLLYIWVPANVARDVGGWQNVRGTLDAMRAACRKAGFAGLDIVGCVTGADAALLKHMGETGWDASSAYGVAMPQSKVRGRDRDGNPTDDYRTSVLGEADTWKAKKAIGALPDIVDLMMGWDPRPWHGGAHLTTPSPKVFEEACRRMKALVDATPGDGLDKRIVVFDNWCEFGEGHYICPTSQFGFSFIDAIKKVFCPGSPPRQDITPADVGLPCPEKVYLARRKALGGLPGRTRHVVGNLVLWYKFENPANDTFTQDSSACGFVGVKQNFVSAPGHEGEGFLCNGGSVIVGTHKLFFPPEGLTVEMWIKPTKAGQSDHWMINTVGSSDTGWRLGLGGAGKVTFQIPQTPWSHGVSCPKPAPVGKWTYVAATYDDHMMRIYINGKEDASLVRDGAINPSGQNVCIGDYSPGNTHAFFQGVLDDVRIYNRALTADEIKADMAK